MKNEMKLLDKAFLFSVVLGPSAAYSFVYLFHFVVAAKVARSYASTTHKGAIRIPRELHWDVIFFAFLFVWYLLSIIWAENKFYAIQYSGYILLAIVAIFYTTQICNTKNRLISAYKFLAILISIEIFLSSLEGMGLIRLPFSPFSPYYSYFGRDLRDLSDFSVTAVAYIERMPTGFFDNPNNLAAFSALIFPFFLLHRRPIVKLIGSIAVFYVIYMCGARAALIAYGIVIFVSAILWGGFAGRIGMLVALVLVGTAGAGVFDSLSQSNTLRIAEIGNLGGAVEDMWGGLRAGQELSQGSTGARAQLILNGLDALKESNGLGVGGGGSKTVQEKSFYQVGRLTSMHNFWVELLVEGGVLIALVFGAWYTSFLWRLWKVARFSTDLTLRYFGRSLFAGFLGFLAGAIGPSSVIYMLPMWMMVGVGLSVIRIADVQRVPARARRQRPRPAMIQRPSRPDRAAGHQGI